MWAVGLEVVDEPLPEDIRNSFKWGLAAKRAAVASLFPLLSTVIHRWSALCSTVSGEACLPVADKRCIQTIRCAQ